MMWPVFEQQSSEDTGPVLGSDLIGDDHRLHYQMGNARQRVLLEVQENGTCRTTAAEGKDESKVRSEKDVWTVLLSTMWYLCHSVSLIHKGRSSSWRSPCVMVRRSSSRLRKDREATWGFPQRSVSSSTSSSNLIQRARSFQRISWSFSTISSLSSTNSWEIKYKQITSVFIENHELFVPVF